MQLLYNSDSYLAFEQKKTLSCASAIKDCRYYQHCHSRDFLFTNKLSVSGIVVLCSDQKFINLSQKIDIKIEITIFKKSNQIDQK